VGGDRSRIKSGMILEDYLPPAPGPPIATASIGAAPARRCIAST
jgi:hypothetical protein